MYNVQKVSKLRSKYREEGKKVEIEYYGVRGGRREEKDPRKRGNVLSKITPHVKNTLTKIRRKN